MSKYTIYHNPRCSKSRQALALLEEKGVEIDVVEYLKEKPTTKVFEGLIKSSDDEPERFLRKKEKEFSEFKGQDFSTAKKVAAILSKFPKLLERPVVSSKGRAVIARPPERVLELI